MTPRRRPPWLPLIFLAFGVAIVAGGFSVLADQRSGTPGGGHGDVGKTIDVRWRD